MSKETGTWEKELGPGTGTLKQQQGSGRAGLEGRARTGKKQETGWQGALGLLQS